MSDRAGHPSSLSRWLASFGGAGAAFVLLAIMFAVYAGRQPSALTAFGLGNLVNNGVVLALAAAGLTLIVLIGELDLSGIGVLAVSNVVVATTSTGSLGTVGSLVLVLLIGLFVGLVNGWLVAVMGLQSLAATLGSMIVCQGVALLILAAPGGEVTDTIAYGLTDSFAGVPIAAIVLAGGVLLWLFLRRTALGVALYAVGTDPTAAELSGINVRFTRIAAFAGGGLCYALAGYYFSAEIGSGDPRVNDTFLLFMFASVAIGGTSLMGGRGGVIGSFIGAGILTVMQKMLFALGVAEFYTNVFSGLIMIVAIFFGQISVLLARLGRRRSPA